MATSKAKPKVSKGIIHNLPKGVKAEVVGSVVTPAPRVVARPESFGAVLRRLVGMGGQTDVRSAQLDEVKAGVMNELKSFKGEGAAWSGAPFRHVMLPERPVAKASPSRGVWGVSLVILALLMGGIWMVGRLTPPAGPVPAAVVAGHRPTEIIVLEPAAGPAPVAAVSAASDAQRAVKLVDVEKQVVAGGDSFQVAVHLANVGGADLRDVMVRLVFGDAAGVPLKTFEAPAVVALGAGRVAALTWNVPVDAANGHDVAVAALPLEALSVKADVVGAR